VTAGDDQPRQDLPDPEVPASLYDEHYYLTANWGYDTWSESGGRSISPIYRGAVARAGVAAGSVVVDIGTGRGELLVAALEAGAGQAIGVEYSPAAIAMTETTLSEHGAGDRARVVEADARAIPLDDGLADLVTMLDVVEHLAPSELAATFAEAHRILRPGGRIVVHTMPNRRIYDVTYRLQRRLVPGRTRRWPADPRNDWERSMHVNEQSARSLAAALREAGFEANVTHGQLVYADFVPDPRARALYRRLASVPGLRSFGSGDLWGEGRRTAGQR
jgi:ubiquinone/menaquinone biosynthesis C-methylase UbiE